MRREKVKVSESRTLARKRFKPFKKRFKKDLQPEHGVERVSYTLKESRFQGGERESKQIEPPYEK